MIDIAWWSAEVIRKAEAIIEEKGVQRDEEQPDVWRVMSLRDQHLWYRIQTDGRTWITCNCPNGQRQSGMTPSCYHTAAVLMQYLPDKGRLHVVEDS